MRANRQAHFIGEQAEIWNPGMTRSPGMRGGMYAQRGEAEFLVLSLWRSVTDHERYLSECFPNLREKAGAADDLDSITGDLVTSNVACQQHGLWREFRALARIP